MVEKLVALGPYTVSNLIRSVLRFGPHLFEHMDVLVDSLWGESRLSARERYALYLRLARLSRSPLALVTYPAVAKVVGLSSEEIDAALEGDTSKLDEETARVVAWAGAVAASRGEMPLEWPTEARDMTMRERERVLMVTRLVLVLNAFALLPVPKAFLGVDPQELTHVRKP